MNFTDQTFVRVKSIRQKAIYRDEYNLSEIYNRDFYVRHENFDVEF